MPFRSDNHQPWFGAALVIAAQRSKQISKQLLREHQQPATDPGIDDAFKDYPARRKLARAPEHCVACRQVGRHTDLRSG